MGNSRRASCGWIFGWIVACGCAGTGATVQRPVEPSSTAPEPIASEGDEGPRVVDIALAYERSCARLSDGTVKCWGLGYDDVARSWPTRVDGLDGALGIALSSTHACARVDGGRVRCWGHNDGGALGDGTHKDARFPTADPGLASVDDIVVGTDATCALRAGEALCWGDNRAGTLGLGASSEEELHPSAVPSLGPLRALSLAGRHGMALLEGGAVACFGDALCGATPAKSPVRLASVSHVLEIAVARGHACVRLESGAIACWGDNSAGQLGDGTRIARDAPVMVAGIADAVQIVAAEKTTCARLANGTVSCWGANAFGQLGDGTTNDSAVPIRVTNLSGVRQIAVGGSHTCALVETGLPSSSVHCWGSNNSGELGDRTRTPRSIRGPVLF